MHIALRNALKLLLSIALILPFPGTGLTQTAERERFADAIEIVDEMIAALPQEALGVDGIIRATGGDAGALIDHVTNRIGYAPYAGVLRNVEGTIYTSRGNALDQALVLATALNRSGYEARIVETTIGETDIGALLKQATLPLPANDFSEVEERLSELGGEMRALFDAPESPASTQTDTTSSELRERVIEKARAGAVAVQAALDGAGTAFIDRAEGELRAAIATYHFVEWRQSAEAEWQAAHPALGAAPVEPGERTRVFLSEIPDDLLHKLTFTALVGRGIGKGGATEVVGKFTAPTFNYLFRTPVYVAQPIGVTEPEQLIEGPFDAITRFVPTFAGRPMDGVKAFTLDGTVADLEALANPAAGIFLTVGGLTGEAAGALSSPGEEDSKPSRLLAHQIKIDTTGPATPPQSVTRTLFDASDFDEADPDAVRARVHALTQNMQLSVDVGPASDIWILKTQLEKLRAGLEFLERGDVTLDELPDEITDLVVKSLPGLSARDDLGTAVQLSPTISFLYNRLQPGSAVATTFDIAIDPRMMLDGSGAVDRSAAIEYGLHVSLMEALALIQDRETRVGDVLLADTTAAERLLSRVDEWQVEDRDGRVALVATTGDYFDVDMSTGLAIGRDVIGQGSTTEYLYLLATEINLIKFLASMIKCEAGSSDYNAKSKCVSCAFGALVMGQAGLALGVILSPGNVLAVSMVAIGAAETAHILAC